LSGYHPAWAGRRETLLNIRNLTSIYKVNNSGDGQYTRGERFFIWRGIIRTDSAIHEIDEISAPAEILFKYAVLTEPELFLVKNHPFFGYEAMRKFVSYGQLTVIVHRHHERQDGSGYPQQLKNGLSSNSEFSPCQMQLKPWFRPYKPALEKEIENNSGFLYDRNVVMRV
jgi:hypothetical protein